MLDYICPAEIAPICIERRHAGSTVIKTIAGTTTLSGDRLAPDARLSGSSISVTLPDVGVPIAGDGARRACEDAECIVFRVQRQTPTELTWAVAPSNGGSYYIMRYVVSIRADSEAALETIVDGLGIRFANEQIVQLGGLIASSTALNATTAQ